VVVPKSLHGMLARKRMSARTEREALEKVGAFRPSAIIE